MVGGMASPDKGRPDSFSHGRAHTHTNVRFALSSAKKWHKSET
jgi:hypothetical protein